MKLFDVDILASLMVQGKTFLIGFQNVYTNLISVPFYRLLVDNRKISYLGHICYIKNCILL